MAITERVQRVDILEQKIELFKKVGVSERYMRLDMDRIKDISGELVDYIE